VFICVYPWLIVFMRILFIGDIVGKPGVRLVQQVVPALRAAGRCDFVIANAENAASNGSGCTPSDYRRLREAGVDLITPAPTRGANLQTGQPADEGAWQGVRAGDGRRRNNNRGIQPLGPNVHAARR
jgi:hypothetical protein